jgi:hypothetical protein
MTGPPFIRFLVIDMAGEHGVQFDTPDTAQGSAWGGRVEHYLTDPAQEPGPAKWETDVPYLTA